MPRRASKKKKQERIKAIDAEIEKFDDETRKSNALKAMPDSELFLIDTVGATGARKRRDKVIAQEARGEYGKGAVMRSASLKRKAMERANRERRQRRRQLEKQKRERKKRQKKSHEGTPDDSTVVAVVDVPKKTGRASGELYDAWGEEDTSAEMTSTKGWQGTLQKLPKEYKKRRRGERASSKSSLTAADVVDAGASYNPERKAHRALMAKALAEETKFQREAASIRARLNPAPPRADPDLVLSDSEGESDDIGEDEEGDGKTKAPRKKERLTQAQRNRQERHREKLQRDKERRAHRQLKGDMSNLKSIMKDLAKEEDEYAKKKQRKAVWAAQKVLEPPVLQRGGQKLRQQIDIQLAEDIPDSIRRLEPVGNPIKDRFHNLMRRNKVDIGRDVKSKKARYKEFPREKNWQIDTASVSATKPPRQSGVTISARKEKARRTSSTTKRVLTHSDASETKRRKKMKQKRSRA
eukprot:g1167.t1